MTWTTDNIDIFRDGQKRARLTQSSSDGEPICAALNFCNVPLPEGPDAPTLSDVLGALRKLHSWSRPFVEKSPISAETLWRNFPEAVAEARTLLAAFQPVEPEETSDE